LDIHAVVSRQSDVIDLFHVPNLSQYKAVKYYEKAIHDANYRILVRSLVDDNSISEDGNIVTSICGELFCDRRRINTYQFVQMYKELGNEVFRKLRGTYDIIMVQKSPLKVISVTDPLGLIPIFYYYDNQSLILSTKLDFVVNNVGSSLRGVDHLAVLEQVCFNFILGDKTYFKNICMQNAGAILEFDFTNDQISKKEQVYWHLSDYMGKEQISTHDALERYRQEFADVVGTCVRSSESPVLALTAGYDTRTNLAVLARGFRTIPCFSYGIRGSDDIEIPLLIKEKFGINYAPLYLEGCFEDSIVDFAENAILHSDGLGDLEKANNEYAYRSLATEYTDVLVGLLGSEFLKAHTFPSRLMPRCILQYFRDSNNRQGYVDDLLNRDLLNSLAVNVHDYIEDQYMSNYERLSDREKFYLFYYYEGIRKYYMKELRIGRYYLNVFSPYTDISLLEIIFRSKLACVNHDDSFLHRVSDKLRSHFVYSYIIEKHMPELLDIITDRGYKPKYDLSLFKVCLMLPQYGLHKLRRQTKQYMYDKWARPFVTRYAEILRNSAELQPLSESSKWNATIVPSERMHRLISIAFYLDTI
jgi:hypothetical protein